MNFTLSILAGLVLLGGAVVGATPSLAAHAGAPYTNVDPRNDLGNDTGDSKVEGLNESQLNQNYRGPVELRPTNPPMIVQQTPPAAAPR